MSATPDRELVFSRLLKAPRALVFSAWTKAEHLDRWWGPYGFTTTTFEIEFRVGGKWRYNMRGPDGTDYPNWIVWTKIVEPELLEYDHGGEDNEPRHFQVETTFTEEAGGTRISMCLIMPTREALEEVKKHGATDGGNQTLARLDEYVATLS